MRVERFNQNQQIIEEAEEKEELRKHETIIRDTLRMNWFLFSFSGQYPISTRTEDLRNKLLCVIEYCF